nr:13418_t:CDS:2 [Entrophospora candida]
MMRKNKYTGPCAVENCKENEKSPEYVTFRSITDKAFDKLTKHPDYLSINYLKKKSTTLFYTLYVEHKYKEVNKNELSGEYSLDDIKINITENGILLSEEDFSLLVQKIENLEAKVEKNKEIENIFNMNNIFLTVQNNLEKNKIELLTNILFQQQHKSNEDIELDPINFCKLIEDKEPKLKGFFNELTKIIPEERTYLNKESAKKSIVGFCYLLAGIRNKFVNNFKLDLGLYLEENGTNAAALDTLSNANLSACYKTIQNYKKNIAENHQKKVETYFTNYLPYMHCFNIDDFHSIHEWRRPDSTTPSSAVHMATCIAKRIDNVWAVPANFNNVPIFNPNNIDYSLNKLKTY